MIISKVLGNLMAMGTGGSINGIGNVISAREVMANRVFSMDVREMVVDVFRDVWKNPDNYYR
ncbi:MAG: hypothetical protein JXA98_00170 [Methanosarcinaceae archaeon]|nr:hypothetical protein [Methanosarcinaceae archaeon]